MGHLESKEADVELSAFFDALRGDVGDDSLDTHQHTMPVQSSTSPQDG
jgi:hypothetical protein